MSRPSAANLVNAANVCVDFVAHIFQHCQDPALFPLLSFPFLSSPFLSFPFLSFPLYSKLAALLCFPENYARALTSFVMSARCADEARKAQEKKKHREWWKNNSS